jgi:hypothetical protein
VVLAWKGWWYTCFPKYAPYQVVAVVRALPAGGTDVLCGVRPRYKGALLSFGHADRFSTQLANDIASQLHAGAPATDAANLVVTSTERKRPPDLVWLGLMLIAAIFAPPIAVALAVWDLEKGHRLGRKTAGVVLALGVVVTVAEFVHL